MRRQEEEARLKKETEERQERERKEAEESALRKQRQEEWVRLLNILSIGKKRYGLRLLPINTASGHLCHLDISWCINVLNVY